MKRFFRKIRFIWLSILAGITSSALPFINIALAATTIMTMAVNNTGPTSYTSVPFIFDSTNDALIAAGRMGADGMDSRVLDANGVSLPHMLADNNTLFVADAPAHVSSPFSFTTGNAPLSNLPVIVGSSGNVSTPDNATLELGRYFDISISGYVNTAFGSGKNVLYKKDAAKIDVSALGTITFHALSTNDTEIWSFGAAGVSSGEHTIRVYADGNTAFMYIDGVLEATHTLTSTLETAIGSVTSFTTGLGDWNHATMWMPVASRYFIWYVDNSTLKFRSSVDGGTWSSATAVSPAVITNTSQNDWSVTSNATHIYYTYRPDTTHIVYRMGLANADGSITWLAAEQSVGVTASAGANIQVEGLSGHVQIVYDVNQIAGYIYSIRNDNLDGTWSTTAGYPVAIFSGWLFADPIWPSLWADQSSNRMYCIINGDPGGPNTVTGFYYNGTVWSSTPETFGVSWDSVQYRYFSAVFPADGNIVVAWINTYGSGTLQIRTRYGAGSYSATQNVTSGAIYDFSLVYDSSADTTYIFYPNSVDKDIHFRTYKAGVLSADQTMLATTWEQSGWSAASYVINNHWIVANQYSGALKTAYLQWSWSWNDSAYPWWWMVGNSMSYADNISVSPFGDNTLLYMPNDIIHGTNLPDLSGSGNNGVIYWGTSTLTVGSSANLITLPATNITTSTATLNAQLFDMVGVTSFSTFFEIGQTTAYGSTTSMVTMTAPGFLTANVSGLFPGTHYHFRAVATSANLTLYGNDVTFTTLVGPGGGNFQFGGGNARVFKNYITANDTLITAEIVNTYVPYYPNQSPKEYFTVQLISTDNSTILAATPQQDWGDKPIGIYLNPTQSRTITDGAGYYVRIQANFASNVSVQYQLQNVPWNNDWKGGDLTKLDDWAGYVAENMQVFYSGAGYVTVLTDNHLVITDAVGGYFTTGIAGIGQVRPNLFTTSQQNALFTMGVSQLPTDNLTAYTAYVGSNIATDAAVIATPFGLTARDVLAGIICLAMLGVIMTGTSMMGGFGALGLFLISIPFLWLGTYFKIIGVQWVMILTIIFGFFAVRQFIIKTT